jgi:hypothetical protein
MPQIPEFQAQAPFGELPIESDTARADPNALAAPGRATEQLGRAVGGVGDALGKLQEFHDLDFVASNRTELATAAHQRLQAGKDAAAEAGDATGFARDMAAKFDEDLQGRLQNAPSPRARQALIDQSGSLADQIGGDASVFEHGMKVQNARAMVINEVGPTANRVRGNPAAAPEEWGRIGGMIAGYGHAGAFNPEEVAKLSHAASNEIWSAEALGRAPHDPSVLDDIKSGKYDDHIDFEAQQALLPHLMSAAAGGISAQLPTTAAVASGGGGSVTPQQGDVGMRVAQTLRDRGWSDAAITGALNNGIGESGLKEWNNPGAGGEQGVFQFHPDSHLPAFQAAYKGDHSAEAQANYLADVVDKTMPGYAQSGDARGATSRFLKEFEAPQDQSDAALAARGGNTPKSQAILAQLGAAGNQTTGAAPKPFDLTVGDSIAGGLVRYAGLPGKMGANPSATEADAANSRSPQQVLDFIASRPEGYFQGKNVLLSTGASNDPSQIDRVPQQVKALQDAGAASVTILGVGTKPSLAGVNDKLAGIEGARFAGPLANVGPDGVHPADWAAVKAQALGTGTAGPPAPSAGGGLAGLFAHVDSMGLDPDLAAKVKVNARLNYDALEADQLRQQRMQDKAQTERVHAAEDHVIADQPAYGGKGEISAQQVANDPAFADHPEARLRAIQIIRNAGEAGPAAGPSHMATLDLVKRINLPDGAQGKITDRAPIVDALGSNTITKPDFDFAMKQFTDVRDPAGETLAKDKAAFLKAVEPQIDRTWLLEEKGKKDVGGALRFYDFQKMLDQQIADYRKTGNPSDLLTPGNPHYLGTPEALKPYKRTFQQMMDDINVAQFGATGRDEAPVDLKTPAGLKAAFAAGKISREAADAIALEKHWIAPPPAPDPRDALAAPLAGSPAAPAVPPAASPAAPAVPPAASPAAPAVPPAAEGALSEFETRVMADFNAGKITRTQVQEALRDGYYPTAWEKLWEKIPPLY